MKVIIRRGIATAVGISVLYLFLLAYPQPLFAYQLEHAGITVYATTPVPDAMRATLDRVRHRINRSPLIDPTQRHAVFICNTPWIFALFARTNHRAGGIADAFVGQHVFLRESDMARDRLISPGGQPVAEDRPLSYFIAHELMHIAQVRYLGRLGYARLPRWTDDGYADYIARDYDLKEAWRKMKDGTRELDPNQSGLYIRYHLLVAYLLEKRGVELPALLTNPPERGALEREVLHLTDWP
jgi:hypothetical protein